MLVACTSSTKTAPAAEEKRYPMSGELIRLDEQNKVAIIKHGEITGFMEAMTMGFPVPDAAEWAKLKPGMKLKAVVIDRKDDFYLTAIEEEK